MCSDAEGGIWTARWGAGKVLRLSPQGDIDVEIDIPSAWYITCVVFGGPDLEDLYITSASSDYLGLDVPGRSSGGDLFVAKAVGFKGVERHRFKGGVLPF